MVLIVGDKNKQIEDGNYGRKRNDNITGEG